MMDVLDNAFGVTTSQLYLHNYLTLLGIVVLLYDHALTFGDEYKRVWLNARPGASALFFATRYFALFVNLAIAAGNFSHYSSIERYAHRVQRSHLLPSSLTDIFSCSRYSLFRQIALIVSQCMVGLIQMLRTYALYGRSLRIAILVFGTGAGLSILSIWAIICQKSEVIMSHGCHEASSRTTAIRIAVAWESLFLFDLLIFSLTFYKSYQQRFRFAHTGQNDLVALIVRDGAIYFAVMACAQCANTLTFYLLAPELRGVLSTLASNISVTMMSRLMLNLHRQAAYRSRESTTEFGYAKSTMVFRVPPTTHLLPTALVTSSTASSGSVSRECTGTMGEHELR